MSPKPSSPAGLLGGARYVAHFTNVWRALLLPEAGNNFQVRLQQGGFEAWLKKQVARNAGYDRILTAGFIAAFENRMINIHPSLLPAFAGGMDSVAQALARVANATAG